MGCVARSYHWAVPGPLPLESEQSSAAQDIDRHPLFPVRDAGSWKSRASLAAGIALLGISAIGLATSLCGQSTASIAVIASCWALAVAGTALCAGFWILGLRDVLGRTREQARSLNEMQVSLRRRNRDLEQQSRTDILTGVGNRLLLSETLEFEVQRADRYGEPLSMALVEVGGLRRLHVRMGRQAVDEAIRQAAARIQDSVGPSDWIFRWGDGEFVVVWLNTDSLQADDRACKLYEILREGLLRDGQELPVSVGATT